MLIINSFRIGTTVCYPDKSDAANFFCLPEVVSPERDVLHRPTVTLLLAGGQSLLQIGVRWELEQDTLATLKKAIIARFPALIPAAIRLSMPAVTVGAVELLLGDGNGAVNVLASKASSGFPPYTAIFSQPLSPAQQTGATAALTGRPGFLHVRYPILLPVETTATTTLSGDVAPEIAQLQTATFIIDPTPLLLQQAIGAGRLVLTRTRTGEPTEATVKAADNQVMQRAAALLRQMAGPQQTSAGPIVSPPVGQSRTATLTATASASATVATPWDVVTDVSTWFTAEQGLKHIVTGPGGGGEPAKTKPPQTQVPQSPVVAGPTKLPVQLSFDAAGTAINFVRVRQGTNQATLTGPDYTPVLLPVMANEPVQITVEYTDGGPAFTATIATPGPAGWTMTPANLGLTQITVDTTELFKTDVTAARLHIRYQPGGTGTDDDRTLNFRARDAERVSTWFVVSRAAGLDGTLTYDLKLTLVSGPPVTRDTVTTRDPVIRL